MRLKHKRPNSCVGRHPSGSGGSSVGSSNGAAAAGSGSAPAEEIMLTPIEQMAESFHQGEPVVPAHVEAASAATTSGPPGEQYQPWGIAHMHIANSVYLHVS